LILTLLVKKIIFTVLIDSFFYGAERFRDKRSTKTFRVIFSRNSPASRYFILMAAEGLMRAVKKTL